MKKAISVLLSLGLLGTLMTGCGQTEQEAQTDTSSQEETAASGEGEYYTLEELGVEYPLPMDKPNILPTKAKPEEKVRIAILGYATNPYWVGLQDTGKVVEDVLENQVGGAEVDWIIIGEDFSAQKHISTIETTMAKQYDVILTPVTDDGAVPMLEKAMAQGITVGTYVTESPGMKETDRFALFGQDTEATGEEAGKFLNEKLGGQGKIGFITGAFGVTSFEARMDGAKSQLDSSIEIVGPYENSDQAEKAYSITKDMLTADPDLNAVYVVGGGAHGACRAIEELGVEDQVAVVGFDLTEENIENLEKGTMAATVADSALAQLFDLAMSAYNYRVTGEEPPQKEMWTDLFVITPENVQDYTE